LGLPYALLALPFFRVSLFSLIGFAQPEFFQSVTESRTTQTQHAGSPAFVPTAALKGLLQKHPLMGFKIKS
jgi:hypothetical protein